MKLNKFQRERDLVDWLAESLLPLLLLLLGEAAPLATLGGTGEEEEAGGGRREGGGGGGGEVGWVTRYFFVGSVSGLNLRPRLLVGGDDL